MELLSLAVEQWKDELGEPLGINYPVVVRPRERMSKSGLRKDWQYRWNRSLAKRKVTFVPSRWSLGEEQQRQLSVAARSGACIALSFPPNLRAPPNQNDVGYLLHVGTVIALWPRRRDGLADFTRQLKKFLADKPLKDLPITIRDMRYELWEQGLENAACYHLTLLWDDPTRLIPSELQNGDHFLVAPT